MFISLDLETTGFDPQKDHIIEFGAVKFDLNGEKERLQFLAHPGITLPQIITHITGITDEDLKDAPKFEENAQRVQEFIGDLPIVGHNIKFDTGFLRANGIEITNPEYDTFILSSMLLPGLPSYSLEILTEILELQHESAHRALDDAIAAMELFIKLANEFQSLPKDLIEKIHHHLKRSTWDTKDFLLSLKANGKEENKTPQKEKKENTQSPHTETILKNNESTLFQTTPPYADLVKDLITKITPDSYISVPYQLFRKIEQDIPDSIAKIDTPNNYLSPHRLELFSQKSKFDKHETSALVKFTIWKERTTTGLFSELKLTSEEKKLIQRVGIDKNSHPLEQEPFWQKALQKDKESAALCTHNYLLEESPQADTKYIFDFEKLTRDIFYKKTHFLSIEKVLNALDTLQEIKPNFDAITNLKAKSEIIFGLMGMFFDKYNDKNTFQARATLNEFDTPPSEWRNLSEAAQNLIEISKELAEINDQTTSPYLQNWKGILQAFQAIFIESDTSKNLVWIEQNMHQEVLAQLAPVSLKEDVEKCISNCQNFKIISENLDLNDQSKFIKDLYGIPEETPVKNLIEKSTTPLTIIEDTPQDERNEQTLIHQLKTFLVNNPGSAIVYNSKDRVKHFTLALTPHLQEQGINVVTQMTGSLGKISEQFKKDPTNSILFITPNFWDNFHHHHLVKTLLVHKMPFDPPSEPFITSQSKNFQDPFNQFQIPRVNLNLQKILNRFKTANAKQIFLLDSRIINKRYGKLIHENLQQNYDISTISLEHLNQ